MRTAPARCLLLVLCAAAGATSVMASREKTEEIARFKKLTPAQKALLLSASKEAGEYTAGGVLSKDLETLFRVVPPSLYLALAMTEPEEKAERWMLMQAHNCSELEAAFSIAERIDKTRGIGPSD